MVTIGATSRAREEFAPELLAVALYKGRARGTSAKTPRESCRAEISAANGRDSPALRAGRARAPPLARRPRGEGLFTLEKLRRAAATVARRARALKLHSAAFSLPALPDTTKEIRGTVAEGARLGLYRFDRHKSAAEDHDLETFWLVADEGELDEAAEGAELGARSRRGPCWPATSPTSRPTWQLRSISHRGPARRKVRYGARGSRPGRHRRRGAHGLGYRRPLASNEPYFIALEHRGGGDSAPVVLIGKAVTFDSGGISIKPSAGMEDMKFDMSGGAAVLGAMEAAGALDSRSTSSPSCRRPRTCPVGTPSNPATY